MEDAQNLRDFGGLDYDDGAEVIVEYMGLSAANVRGMQKQGIGARRMEIALDEDLFYSTDVQRLIGESLRLSSDRKVWISVPDYEVTDVYIKGIPMTWTLEKVKRIFSYYGEIKKVYNMRLQASDIHLQYKDFVGCPNGNLKIKIKSKDNKEIPSSLNIDNKF